MKFREITNWVIHTSSTHFPRVYLTSEGAAVKMQTLLGKILIKHNLLEIPVIEAKLNIEIYETQPNITLINCYKSSFLCSSTFGSFSELVAGSVQLS